MRLTRDRPTWLIYLQLGTFATYLYGLSAALPLLQKDQRVSQTVAGLHGTSMALCGIAAGLALPYLVRKYGRRATTWIGLAGVNAGVLLVVATTALPATLLGYGLASGFGTLTLYASMAALSDHHGPAGPAAISEANAVGATIALFAPFLLSAAAQSAAGWRAALLLTPACTLVLALTLGRYWIPEEDHQGEHRQHRGRFGWKFYAAGAVLFCCVALEFTFNLWAAVLVTTRTGLTPERAAITVTALAAGLAAGRFVGARLALRLTTTTLLVGALAVTGAGWVLFWLSTNPVLSLTGVVVCGLGIALHFPLALSGVIANSGGRPDRASAIGSIWASVAVGAGPLVLGALADGYGTVNAFLMVPVLIGLAVAGVLSARPRP
ncbi:MFS transporter [Nonomuraea sp. NPDC050328]|uniref:MFS transporter n=1 Tax=Nonomuraea sp. NPDC050328 TaxID=3364361 RepID=UPI003793B0B0